MDTRLKKSTNFHPQIDGWTEVVNKIVIQLLRVYCSKHPKLWDEHLCYVLHDYNWVKCMYIGKSRWKAFSPIFSSILKGPYLIGFSFLLSPCILSLMIYSQTWSQTWKLCSIWCLSCFALYLAWLFSRCYSIAWWIPWIFSMNLVTLSTSLRPSTMMSLPKTKSKGDLDVKPKQVSKGDLCVEECLSQL